MPKTNTYPTLTFQEVKTLAGEFIECRWGHYSIGSGRTEFEAARAASANLNDIVGKLRAAGYRVNIDSE